MRIAGAGHTPEKLARVAYRKHVRMARVEGGALGIGGIVTAAPDLVALLWIQSRMVFYIAAAYGYDTTHPMRPAELLGRVTRAGDPHPLLGLGAEALGRGQRDVLRRSLRFRQQAVPERARRTLYWVK